MKTEKCSIRFMVEKNRTNHLNASVHFKLHERQLESNDLKWEKLKMHNANKRTQNRTKKFDLKQINK